MQMILLIISFLFTSLTFASQAQAKWHYDSTGFSGKFNAVIIADEIDRKKIPIQLQSASYYPIKSEVADFLIIFDYYCSNVACSIFVIKQDKVLYEINSYGFPLNIRSSPKVVNFEIVDLNENSQNEEKITYDIMINNSEIKKTPTYKKPTILWRRDIIK